ncbi:MAG: hypothetical protein ACI8P9_003693 [Parasphingorhabdus sp.]|jgi:hypothetical protein
MLQAQDIVPENILCRVLGFVVILDLALSRYESGTFADHNCGDYGVIAIGAGKTHAH